MDATDDPPADPAPGTMLSTVQLARLLPGGTKDRRKGVAGGGACHASRATVNRWCSKGVTVGGRRVKLAAIRRGGKWFVRWADWVAFRDACTKAAGGDPVRVETPAERRRRAKRAVAEFEKACDEVTRAK